MLCVSVCESESEKEVDLERIFPLFGAYCFSYLHTKDKVPD